MIKVLLVSPTDPEKPTKLKSLVGGENTFTKSLLENPLEGIEYIHHFDAEKKGLIEYTFLHRLLNLLILLRILPMSAGSRIFKVNTGFDLIHCHGYSVKVINENIPIVFSDSSSNYLFLRDYLEWGEWKIRFGFFLRRILFKFLGIIDCDTNWEKAKKIIVFSKFAFGLHKRLGVSNSKMIVINPGLSKQKILTKREGDKVNILFVGIWFERKGGYLLLEAFKSLSKRYKNIELTVVGEVSKNSKLQITNAKFYNYISRDKLMKEFFPKADIFVLVPPKVEGYGFAVLEAMSFGLPVIVSRVCALSELVEDEKTGFVIKPNSVEDLTFYLEKLIRDRVLRGKMGKAARKRFEDRFTIDKSNENLWKVYRQALL